MTIPSKVTHDRQFPNTQSRIQFNYSMQENEKKREEVESSLAFVVQVFSVPTISDWKITHWHIHEILAGIWFSTTPQTKIEGVMRWGTQKRVNERQRRMQDTSTSTYISTHARRCWLAAAVIARTLYNSYWSLTLHNMFSFEFHSKHQFYYLLLLALRCIGCSRCHLIRFDAAFRFSSCRFLFSAPISMVH